MLRPYAGAMVELLAEAATASALRPYHIDEVKEAVFADAVEAKATSTQSLLLEGLHAAAYGGSAAGLGRRLWAEDGDVPLLSSEHLAAHIAAHFTAGNAVLAGTNVSHEALVEAAGRHLGGLPSGAARQATPAPAWRGGDHHLRARRGEGMASLAMAFPAPPAGAGGRGAAAGHVLAALLGGTSHRGPWRAGLPGLSRLARAGAAAGEGAVLRAFYLPGRDAGMLGVWGSLPAEGASPALLELVAGSLRALRGGAGIGAEELARAKAGARLRAAVAGEERESRRAALGAAALATGSAGATLQQELSDIDKVSAGDVAALLASALKAPPAVAAITGEDFPRYESVKGLLA